MITLPANVTFAIGRISAKLAKHAPEILTVLGVAGVGAGTVMCCKATLKVDEILEKAESDRENIETVHAMDRDDYSEDDYHKDLRIVKVNTATSLIREYAPAIAVVGLGVACLLGASGILRKRNVALMGLYKGLESHFQNYRKRVVEEHGEETDFRYLHDIREEQVETIRDDGKPVVETRYDVCRDNSSHVTRVFDEFNKNWSSDAKSNKFFITCIQNWANDRLRARGHLFLNEVFEMLGFEHTPEGAITGWVLTDEQRRNGTNFVDFGLYDYDDEAKYAFLKGYEPSVLLEFNTNGIIWDRI